MRKKSIKARLAKLVIFYADIGFAANTLLAYCTGLEYKSPNRPRDLYDVDRCDGLFYSFPEWREKIKHISEKYPCWGVIGEHWDEIVEVYRKEWRDVRPTRIYDLLDKYANFKSEARVK